MTSISKKVYVDKLDETVDIYNNKYHRTIKMKPGDVTSSRYIDFNEENNKEGPKFKVGDIVEISKYKNIFAKGYVPNQSEQVFVIKKIKNTVISDFKGKETVETFCEKELQKTNQKEFRVEKATKRKGDKPNVKWKGYDSSFNSWINKKDIVKMSKYFSEPEPAQSKRGIKVELDLSK